MLKIYLVRFHFINRNGALDLILSRPFSQLQYIAVFGNSFLVKLINNIFYAGKNFELCHYYLNLSYNRNHFIIVLLLSFSIRI